MTAQQQPSGALLVGSVPLSSTEDVFRAASTILGHHLRRIPDGEDESYFVPLRNLALHPATELFLGLVHHTDGVEGTRRRIETARRIVPRFGVATECGLGRRPPETVADLLRTHAAVAQPIQ